MHTETTQISSSPRRSLSLSSRIALIALLGIVLFCGGMAFIVGSIALVVVAGVVLLGAILIATKLRWAPLAGSLLGALLLYYFLLKSSFPIYHLTHPSDDPVFFLLTLLNIICMVLALGAGIYAGVQNYQRRAR